MPVHAYLLSIFLILLPLYVYSDTELPELGEAATLSSEDEDKLIAEFLNYVQNTMKLVDDPLSNDYIQRLGEKLTSQLNSNRKFTFFIVDDPSINAFAGPGGYIGIHTGLMYATASEDELASVLAHEIAHITQNHLFRSIENRGNMTWPTVLAILAAMAVGGNSGGDVGNAIIASTVAGTYQNALAYSRDYEKEADRIGMRLLSQAGFDPKAMPRFFETLQHRHRFSDSSLPEFLRTHPITRSRIADSQARAEQLKVGGHRSQSINYQLNLLRLYYRSKKQPYNLPFKESLSQGNSSLLFKNLEQFEASLIDIHKEHYGKAAKGIAYLIKQDRPRLPYFVTQAEIEYKRKNYQAMLETLQMARLFYPNHISLNSLQVKALIDSGKLELALKTLDKHIQQHRDYAPLYKLKAKAATKLKHQAIADEAMADYYALIGNIHSAIKHLKLALELLKNNRFEKLRLEARIQHFKDKLFNYLPHTDQTTENLRFQTPLF